MEVPFFRPAVGAAEIEAVTECMRSGWLTTGRLTREFEKRFAASIGVPHALALNSCTAALHLALEAIGLERGEVVVVPTMTFAATAEVVRYFDAVPVFVDADPRTLCMDLDKLEATLTALAEGRPFPGVTGKARVRAMIPMHYGGQMLDMDRVSELGRRFGLRVIEDAAHALPASYQSRSDGSWHSVGSKSDVACFSFYANKCITTGEGGMAVTRDEALAQRMQIMSLHGMSKDAWNRFTASGSWYYEIVAPGFKYNLTDIASAIGLVQLERADALWQERRRVAQRYVSALADADFLELPVELDGRRHSFHLFQIQLRLDRLDIDRAAFIAELKARGISVSVHWMPLHLHPYYVKTLGYQPDAFPAARAAWERLISLPIYPYMSEAEQEHVIASLRAIGAAHRRR